MKCTTNFSRSRAARIQEPPPICTSIPPPPPPPPPQPCPINLPSHITWEMDFIVQSDLGPGNWHIKLPTIGSILAGWNGLQFFSTDLGHTTLAGDIHLAYGWDPLNCGQTLHVDFGFFISPIGGSLDVADFYTAGAPFRYEPGSVIMIPNDQTQLAICGLYGHPT
jgi:hypothetical protein